MANRKFIQRRYSYIVENVNLAPMDDILIDDGVFSMDEVEQYNAKPTKKEKVRAMLNILKYKSPDDLDTFLEDLKRTQEHVYDDLVSNWKVSGDDIKITNVMEPWKLYQNREAKQAEMCDAFKDKNTKIVWLSGMTGSGKTQLCWWYARQFRRDYTETNYIVWTIDGSNKENIISGLQNIAVELGEGEKSRACPRANDIHSKEEGKEGFLKDLKTATNQIPTLLIVDNYKADGLNMLRKIETFLKNWKILVNTNEMQMDINPKDAIKVEGFTEDEALTFSKTILQEYDDFKKEDLKDLFISLDYFPLGLTSVLLYMDAMKLDIEHYREILAGQPKLVLEDETEIVKRNTGYANTLFKAIRLVLNNIQEQHKEEFKVLKYMSLCAMDHMLPIKVFISLLPEKEKGDSKLLRMSKLLETLHNVHFLTVSKGLNEERTVAFHKSVQENLEELIEEEKAKTELLSSLMLHIVSHFPKDAVIDEWYQGNRLLKPHILNLLRHSDNVTDRNERDTLVRIKLYDILGYIESKTGLRDEARKHLILAKNEFYELIGYKESNLPLHQLITEGSKIDFESAVVKQQLEEEASCLLEKVNERLSGVLNVDDILTIRKTHIKHAYDRAMNLDNANSNVSRKDVSVLDMYKVLVEKEIVLDQDLLVGIYPHESFAVILYSTVYYKPVNDKEKLLQQHDLHLCKTMCQRIRKNKEFPDDKAFLYEMLSERDGLLELEIKQNSWASLQKAKDAYIGLLKNGKEYIYLGLSFRYNMRGSGGRGNTGESTDLYFQSVCLKQILKCMKGLFKLAKNEASRKKIICEVDDLNTKKAGIIADLECTKDLEYAFSELQIAFGDFYDSIGELQKSVEFYKTVYDNDHNRDFQRLCAAIWLFLHYRRQTDSQNTEYWQVEVSKYKTYAQRMCAKKTWYIVEVEEKTLSMLMENMQDDSHE